MAKIINIIEPEFRVNIYLDTNILIDYVEKQFPLLTRSVDYLANSPYVILRSSHFVLFEFTENRKSRLFWEKADPSKAEEYKTAKVKIKTNWKYNNKEYSEFKDDIANIVEEELNLIKNQLHIDFDEHVLHEDLIYPTNNLCLQTKISKEDCLVMVSCMNPNEGEYLDHCLLLTRDERYYKAYQDNSQELEKVFNERGLNKPVLIRTEDLSLCAGCPKYNLYDNNAFGTDIENYWIGLILKTIKEKFSANYVGVTYEYGSSDEAKQCIFFDMDGTNRELRYSSGLYFVFNDLSGMCILQGPFEYWNGQKITLPHINLDSPKYSFKTDGMDSGVLSKLREEGNLVFYYDV